MMPKLFMIKIGGRPKGRLIEQHDMYFGIGEYISDFIPAINQHWPEVKNKWHLDAYRQVTKIDNYRIEWRDDCGNTDVVNHTDMNAKINTDDFNKSDNSINQAKSINDTTRLKLFFINLGGYLAGEFEEFHHKLLIVAPTQADAIKQARGCDFYKRYSFNDKAMPFNAAAHIDDKHQVDDIHNVNDLLTTGRLYITDLADRATESELPEDIVYIGYLSLKKLRHLYESV